jgi:hypothetical protein
MGEGFVEKGGDNAAVEDALPALEFPLDPSSMISSAQLEEA